MNYFTCDGISWQIPCKIERVAEITPSQISGMLIDKRYFSDVIGTYLKYSLVVAVPFGMEWAYNQLFEILTDPVGYHEFTFPYGNDSVSVTGRVANVSDAFVRMPGDRNYWKGIRFTVTASNPTKTQTLSEAISYGLPPWPQTVELPVGSVWEYTATGWQAYDAPPDADDIYY